MQAKPERKDSSTLRALVSMLTSPHQLDRPFTQSSERITHQPVEMKIKRIRGRELALTLVCRTCVVKGEALFQIGSGGLSGGFT